MARIPGIRRLFRFPSSEDRVRDDVEQEITFHVEARTQELIANGQDPLAARAAAMREFGDVRAARAELETIGRRRVRHVNRVNWWSDLAQDLKYGLRSLLAARLFSSLAIVTLALGIGANAAVFSVLKSVLLDPLPYADADRLVRVYARWLDGTAERGPMAAATIADFAARQRSLARVSAYASGGFDGVLGEASGSRITRIAWVDSTFFDTLGVAAAHGRTFRKDDETSGLVALSGGQLGVDTARGVLLTHTGWQRLFASDPGVLDRDIRINGLPRRVVGILPPRFIGPNGDVDFYFAFDLAPVTAHPNVARGSQWLGAVARLKPGVSEETALRDLDAIGRDLAREFPRDNAGFTITAMPLHEWMIGDTRTPLLILMISAGLVLIMACANLTGALLSRTLTRRKELAVRVALGAGRGRLVRQLLTESVLLAMAGGVAGVGLAWLLLSATRNLARTMLPDFAALTLDGEALLVSALLALGAGLVFGTAPALSADRTDPQDALRCEARGASESRRAGRLRGALVAAQIALCVSLLAGAGLLARSLWAMTTAPLGFDPDGVFTAAIQFPARDYPKQPDRARFLEQFEERLRALPGVTVVADVGEVPTRLGSRLGFSIEGAPQPAINDLQPFVLFTAVSDDYFRALRIPLRQGRTFDTRDREGAPFTVVISEAMARRWWPRGDALGARIRTGPNPKAPLLEIIGIVGDVRNDRGRADAEPMLYRSSRQAGWPRAAFLLRTSADPLTLLKPVERELAAIDPRLALDRATILRASIGEGIARRRMPVMLMTAFGALALLLASIGVYAMFASIAAAREREFGVRMALGSRPRAIAGLVLRQGAGWMAAGLAGGAFGVAIVVRLLRGVIYAVPPFDPIALGAAVAILLCSATLALLVPLRRATRVDPAAALRQ